MASFDSHANFAQTLVFVAPSPAGSGTSLTISTGAGALLPTPPFNMTVQPIGLIPTLANAEIVRVTAIAGDVLTIVRGQEGTTPLAIAVGYQIGATVTAKTLTDIETIAAGASLVINAVQSPYNADPTGATDSTTAIQAALNAANTAGGGIVYLPWGRYLVSSTLSIPPYTFLRGQSKVSLNLFSTVPSTLTRIIASASWAPSSATGIVSVQSKTPGGWSTNTQSCGLADIFLDGSLNSNTNLSGMFLNGPVYDVHLEDVFIWKAPHNGIQMTGQTESGITPTLPYHQKYDRVTASTSGNVGFNFVNMTDSTFVNCLAFGSVGDNFSLGNNSNANFIGCRAEWSSGGRGFDITGSTGSMTFSGCSTDQNNGEGLRIHAVTGQTGHGGGIIWTGGKLHADGNSGTNNHGIIITGSTVPITISGVNVESGQNPNNSNYYPAQALEIDTSSYVTVTGAVLQGTSSAYTNGGSNTDVIMSNCIGATGNPGSQTFSILPNLAAGSNTSQGAPVLTPSFAGGTAAQLSDLTQDYMVYLQCTLAGTALTVAIGPTSTPAYTVINSSTATLGEMITVRLPAGWYLKWSATSATFTQQKAIGC